MARKLNVPLMAGLTIGFCALALTTFTLALLRLRPHDPEVFVQLGREQAAKGRWADARASYLRAWQVSEKPIYLTDVGQMNLDLGEIGLARNAWEQGKQLDPTLVEPREKLLNLYSELARLEQSLPGWMEVKREAEELIALKPDHGEANQKLGLALFALRDQNPEWKEEGLKRLEEAARGTPPTVESVRDYASALRVENRGEEALPLLESLVKEQGEDQSAAVDALWALGEFQFTLDHWEEAAAAFRQARERAKGDAQLEAQSDLRLASLLSAKARTVEKEEAAALRRDAEMLLRQAVAAEPKNVASYLELGRLLADELRFDDALEVCRQRTAAPVDPGGIAHYREKRDLYRLLILASDIARTAAVRLELTNPARNQWLEEAMAFIRQAHSLIPNLPVGFLQEGQVLLAMGRPREALPLFQQADERFLAAGALNWLARLSRARTHLVLGEPGEARTLLEEVLPRAQAVEWAASEYWQALSEARLQAGDARLALAAVDQALTIDPDARTTIELRARCLEALGRKGELEEAVRGLDPSGSLSLILQTRSLEEQGLPHEAVKLLSKHLEDQPGDTAVLEELVRLLVQGDRADEARGWVQKALAARPGDARLGALDLLLTSDLTPEQRSRKFLELIDAQPDPLNRLAGRLSFFMAERRYEEVLTTASETAAWLESNGEKLSGLLARSAWEVVLGDELLAAAALKDWERAQKAALKAGELNLDGVSGRIYRARYHLARQEFEPALRLMNEVLAEQPTNVKALLQAGIACDGLGRLEEALRNLKKAAQVQPDNAPAQRGLAFVAAKMQDGATYNAALDACEKMIPRDPWVSEQLVLRQDQREPDKAIERRRRLFETNPTDEDNAARLAALLTGRPRSEPSDAFFTAVVERFPKDQALVVMAARYFEVGGDREKAENLIARYIEQYSEPTDRANALMVLAAHHQAFGRVPQAEVVLRDAVKLARTRQTCQSLADFIWLNAGRLLQGAARVRALTEAEQWYRATAELIGEEDPAALKAALVRSAAVLVELGADGAARLGEVVADYEKRFPQDPERLYWKAELLVAQGGMGEALESLSQYVDQSEQPIKGRYRRADLYLALGNWDRAIEDLERIKELAPAALDYAPRLRLAGAYEEKGQTDRMLAELEALRREAPDHVGIARALALAYGRVERFADGESLATAWLNRLRGTARIPWLMMCAELAARRGDWEERLRDYQEALALSGGDASLLEGVLGLLTQANRNEAALALLEECASARPLTSRLLVRRAQVLAELGRGEEAVAGLAAAMAAARSEDHSAILYVARSAPLILKDETSRRSLLDAAAKEASLRSFFEFGLADAEGRTEEALAALRKARESAMDPKLAIKAILIEASLVMNDHPDRALACYQEVLAAEPDHLIALNNAAYLLHEVFAKPNEAASLAERGMAAAKDTPLHADLMDTLGWIHVSLGRLDEAVSLLNRACQVRSAQASARYHLGEALRRSRDFEAARSTLQAALSLAKAERNETLAGKIMAALEKAGAGDATP